MAKTKSAGSTQSKKGSAWLFHESDPLDFLPFLYFPDRVDDLFLPEGKASI